MIRDLEALAEMRGYCDAVLNATWQAVARFSDMEQGATTLRDQHLEMRDFMRRMANDVRRRSKEAEHYGLTADAIEKVRCAMIASKAEAEALIQTLDNTILRLNAAGAAVAADYDLSPDETSDENL